MASFFCLTYATKEDLCSVPHEPLAIPGGDGGFVPRKSLERAGESMSEEGKAKDAAVLGGSRFERDLSSLSC